MSETQRITFPNFNQKCDYVLIFPKNSIRLPGNQLIFAVITALCENIIISLFVFQFNNHIVLTHF